MTGTNSLTAERLREVFHYSPETGALTRLVRTAFHTRVGEIAGWTNTDGYRHVRIDRVVYKVHRIAFLYMTGEWPKDAVDHIDGDRANNKWSNLRPATSSQNQANSRANKSSSLPKGVRLYRKNSPRPFGTSIRCNGRIHWLGYFATADEAAAAYIAKAKELFGEFARAA